MGVDEKKRLEKFIILTVLGLLLVNIPLISAYILLVRYGNITLNPGEKYTLNIPFIGESKSPVICGTAEQTDGTLVKNVSVIVKYEDENATLAQNITGSDGKFCVTLPEITSSKHFDIYVQYDNSTLVLGSNDYDMNFDDNKVYSRSTDTQVSLTGDIINEDASVDNGRFEINLKYNETGKFTHSEEIFGYKTYSVNIDPGETFDVSNLNIFWPIDSSTKIGRYKFYIKTSFNGKEKASNVYFNVTA